MRAVLIISGALLGLVLSGAASAATPADDARADIKATLGFVPGFLTAVPDAALPGAWAEMKAIQMNPKTALDAKAKELIGLGVAAQVPCDYCIEAHTAFAKAAGATEEELKEAVAMSALVRHWSTVLNGVLPEDSVWRDDVAKMAESARAAKMQKAEPATPTAGQQEAPPAPAAPQAVTTAEQAKEQIRKLLGTLPVMFERFPDEGLAAAWTEMRDLELSDQTALDPKLKTLIGLAVSAQVPCRYCAEAHTAFGKVLDATEREQEEAIAMAAIVRHWSTVINGMQVEEAAFTRDVDRMVKALKKGAVVEQETYD